jgi:hypothetical protein
MNIRSTHLKSRLLFLAGLSALLCRPGLAQTENVQCRFRFKDVEQELSQDRIRSVIAEYVKGKVEESGSPSNPEYLFSVESLLAARDLNQKLLFETSAPTSNSAQVFNADINLLIDYTTASLEAVLEVTLKFKVTPGAQLFLRNPDGSEKDISDLVTGNGSVTLPVKLQKGQDAIFARTMAGKVEKYMRIGVYNQDVRYISKEEYQ